MSLGDVSGAKRASGPAAPTLQSGARMTTRNGVVGIALVLAGCAMEGPPGTSPIADEGSPTAKADTACGEAYIQFLLERARPAFDDPALDAARADALAREGAALACDDGAAYSTYLGLLAKYVTSPLVRKRGQAMAAFLVAGSEHLGDYDYFVRALAPSAEDERRFGVLTAIAPRPTDAFSYLEWLNAVGTIFEDTTLPLERATSEVIEASYAINPSEQRWLAVIEAVRPSPTEADALGYYASAAYDVFAGTDRVPALSESEFSAPSLAPEHRAALERFAGYRPDLVAEQGGREWIARFAILGAGATLERGASVERLDLFATTRPRTLSGLPAYQAFLEYLPFTPGIADRVLAHKPCVSGSEADDAYASFVTEHERTATSDQARDVVRRAAPVACP